MPRGILKTASTWDKALPQIPSSPALVEVNTKLNTFRHRNGTVSNSHPRKRSASRVLSSHGGRFGVNDSEDDILWTLTTSPCTMDPARTTKKSRNTKQEPIPRSNRMRGKRYRSSRSSRASSIERRPRTLPRKNPGIGGYDSSVSSNAASRASSCHLLHNTFRRYVEELKPVKGLRLSTRKTPISTPTSTPKPSQILPRILGPSFRQEEHVGSSPLLVSSTKSNLRRRPRVDKRGSMSETDSFHDFLNTLIPTTESRCNRSTTRTSNCHPTNPEVSPRAGKQDSRRGSNAHEQVTSAITVHSLPLILPAHAEYKCHVEWESDKGIQSDSDEAGNLWRRLEQECGMSPTPPYLTYGHLHPRDSTFEDVELTPRRGRWKVKVEETPTIPPSISAEISPRVTIKPPCSELKWADEDLQFSESAMGFDDGTVAVLREVSINELLPPLSGYIYLSSLLNKRTSSRHKRRARSRRSSTLRSTRSKTRLSRAEKSRHVVHRDVRRALYGFWENCEDGWIDEEQMEGAAWSSHMRKLLSRSRSKEMSKSSMGRALSGNLLDRGTSAWDRSSVNEEEGMTGLGIVMHHSATLESRATTIGADSIIDFYVAT